MNEIDQESFAAEHAAGAFVVDVREAWEYTGGHVPGAWLIPLNRLPSALVELSRTDPVYVICASGDRSKAAAWFLNAAGLRAFSVTDGTGGWVRAGRPIVIGARKR
ncbi:rhodanese-like domain-containing protein [Catenulispora subtropica]|uniref:Rhodanese domain-containing protein n=1 Tax=Catenulispora subtropica TaxID=450798 RepID=A0ABN2QQL2_9ACTN